MQFYVDFFFQSESRYIPYIKFFQTFTLLYELFVRFYYKYGIFCVLIQQQIIALFAEGSPHKLSNKTFLKHVLYCRSIWTLKFPYITNFS